MGRQPRSAVDEARQEIVKSLRRLEEAGSIVVARSNEDMSDSRRPARPRPAPAPALPHTPEGFHHPPRGSRRVAAS